MKKVKFIRFQAGKKEEEADSNNSSSIVKKWAKNIQNIYNCKDTEEKVNEFLSKDGTEIKVIDV